ncbi:hypothetical protein [Skermanella pratensis]|uniref:hypothetical protein n=1 Tax=Skermanella pratensis TaxID=2233999 RepID=UPI0013015C6D|nr:hypothetical protein [Skermanella pratensis]
MSDTTESLGKTAETLGKSVENFASDAGTAANTVSSGCSGLWNAGMSALELVMDGKSGEAMAVMFSPGLSCYDSVVAAIMGLFPFLS